MMGIEFVEGDGGWMGEMVDGFYEMVMLEVREEEVVECM